MAAPADSAAADSDRQFRSPHGIPQRSVPQDRLGELGCRRAVDCPRRRRRRTLPQEVKSAFSAKSFKSRSAGPVFICL